MKARYYIEWKSGDKEWERIDDASSRNTALFLVREYKLAFGVGSFRIRYKGEFEYF